MAQITGSLNGGNAGRSASTLDSKNICASCVREAWFKWFRSGWVRKRFHFSLGYELGWVVNVDGYGALRAHISHVSGKQRRREDNEERQDSEQPEVRLWEREQGSRKAGERRRVGCAACEFHLLLHLPLRSFILRNKQSNLSYLHFPFFTCDKQPNMAASSLALSPWLPSPRNPFSSSSTAASIPRAFPRRLPSPRASLLDLPLAIMDGADNSGLGFAIAGGGAIAVLAAALSIADPEKRRQQQSATAGGSEKDAVRNYFNTAGFDRWRRIYGDTDDVNDVQLDIRKGHAVTVEKAMGFLRKEEGLKGVTVCDAGCGTGSLTVPMVMEGAIVSASDISEAMVSEAERKTVEAIEASGKKDVTLPQFLASDLESLQGKSHTVVCIDVLIHYPQDKAAAMIAHLASLAERRLIISFAPETPFLALLKRIGELFPGPSKATRAYLHSEADIVAALNAVGWTVRNRDMTSTKFYYSTLLEAVPAGKS